MSIIAILGVLYIHVYPNIRCNTPQQNDAPHLPSTTTPDPQPRIFELKNEDPKATVLFMPYPVQQTS